MPTPQDAIRASIAAQNKKIEKGKVVGTPSSPPSAGLDIQKLSRESQQAWDKSREAEVKKKDAQGNVIGTVKTTSLAGMAPEREGFFKNVPNYQDDPAAYGRAQQAYQEALGQSDMASLSKALFGSSAGQGTTRASLPGQLGRLLNVGEMGQASNYRNLETQGKIDQLQRRADELRRNNNESEAALVDAEIADLQNQLNPDWLESQGVGGQSEIASLIRRLIGDGMYGAAPSGDSEIRFMAGGGAINKPTMAVVGEAGPELAMLQPGDSILPLSMPQANQLLRAGTPGMRHGGQIQETNPYVFGGGQGRIMKGGPGLPINVQLHNMAAKESWGKINPLRGDKSIEELAKEKYIPRPLGSTQRGMELKESTGPSPWQKYYAGGRPEESGLNPRAMPGGIGSGSPEFLTYQRGDASYQFPTPEETYQAGFVPQTYMGQQRGLPQARPATGPSPWERLGIDFGDSQYVDPRIAATQTLGTEELLGTDPTFSGVLPPPPPAAVSPTGPQFSTTEPSAPREAPTIAEQLATIPDMGGVKQPSGVQQPITAGRSVEEEFLSPSELKNTPMYQTADASGMDTKSYLDAAFKGQLNSELINEAQSVLADLNGDIQIIEADIEYLMGLDEDLTPEQKVKLTELRKDQADAVDKYNSVFGVVAEGNRLNTFSVERTQQLTDAATKRAIQLEDQAAVIAENKRQEAFGQMKGTEERALQEERQREQREYDQQQSKAMADSIGQMFSALGINLPADALQGINPQFMPAILQMLFRTQQQQSAAPSGARLGFA